MGNRIRWRLWPAILTAMSVFLEFTHQCRVSLDLHPTPPLRGWPTQGLLKWSPLPTNHSITKAQPEQGTATFSAER